MKASFFKTAYIVVGGMELLSEILRTEVPSLYMFVKPLLMIVLALYLYQTTHLAEKTDKVLLLSLFFSWVGDCVLMFQGELYFLGGLLSFLIAHILYIYVFARQFKLQNGFYLVVICVLLYGAALLGLVLPKTAPEMRLPIGIYAGVLLVMTAMASGRKGGVSLPSFAYTFVGAMLFMFSDSLIAINKFAQPFEGANIAIMLLYIAGQYGIVEGLLISRSSAQLISTGSMQRNVRNKN